MLNFEPTAYSKCMLDVRKVSSTSLNHSTYTRDVEIYCYFVRVVTPIQTPSKEYPSY